MIYTQRIDSVSRWSSNGRPTRGGAAIFAFGTGVTMIALYSFSPNASPVPFYLFAALFFYKLNKRTYNRIVEVIRHRAAKKRGLRSIAK